MTYLSFKRKACVMFCKIKRQHENKVAYIGLISMVMLYFLYVLTTLFSSPLHAQHKPVSVDEVIIKSEGSSYIDHEFSLKYKNLVVFRDNIPLFVLPNEKVNFEILFPYPNDTFKVVNTSNKKNTVIGADETYIFTAPKSGHTKLVFTSQKTKHLIKINVFVKHPVQKMRDGKLQKHVIGDYPKDSSKRYIKPDGFIKVTQANKDLALSENFTLVQFPSKQSNNYPKFVYLKESLILKLEKLRSLLIEDNIDAINIVIMSGYRTPYYNKRIGNVKYSRHVFGDAADIFIDNDKNYRMDDLNGDNKSDYKDAQLLAEHIENYSKKEWYKPFIGGLGVYGSKPHRGPFIHIDNRGVRARWYKP